MTPNGSSTNYCGRNARMRFGIFRCRNQEILLWGMLEWLKADVYQEIGVTMWCGIADLCLGCVESTNKEIKMVSRTQKDGKGTSWLCWLHCLHWIKLSAGVGGEPVRCMSGAWTPTTANYKICWRFMSQFMLHCVDCGFVGFLVIWIWSWSSPCSQIDAILW